MNEEPRPSLGSISRPENLVLPATKTCQRCGSDRLTRIRMRTPGGTDAIFVACLACEKTGWFAAEDGRPLTADEVGDTPS